MKILILNIKGNSPLNHLLFIRDTPKVQPSRNAKNKWVSEYMYDNHMQKENYCQHWCQIKYNLSKNIYQDKISLYSLKNTKLRYFSYEFCTLKKVISKFIKHMVTMLKIKRETNRNIITKA